MTYVIEERDFHYIPEPEDADEEFESVICTKETKKEVHTIDEFLKACIAFNDAFSDVAIFEHFADTIICMVSNSSSDKFSHPDYYYTNRHQISVYPKEK